MLTGTRGGAPGAPVDVPADLDGGQVRRHRLMLLVDPGLGAAVAHPVDELPVGHDAVAGVDEPPVRHDGVAGVGGDSNTNLNQ